MEVNNKTNASEMNVRFAKVITWLAKFFCNLQFNFKFHEEFKIHIPAQLNHFTSDKSTESVMPK